MILGGDNSDRISGSAGNDVLFGRMGNDQLTGGYGDDLLDGGAGKDELSGGNANFDFGYGNDIYIFVRGYGQDTIEDNDSTEGSADTIRLNADVVADDVTIDCLILASTRHSTYIELMIPA